MLTAENFVALDFLDPEACAQALSDALEHLARQLGCAAVHSLIVEGEGRARKGLMAGVLGTQGHKDSGRLFCKVVEKGQSARHEMELPANFRDLKEVIFV